MALSNENKNFLKLQFLVIRSNEHIRNLFLESLKQKTDYACDKNNESLSKFFQNDKNKALLSMMNQAQKNLALAGDTSKWDLSLFFLILSNSDIFDKSSLKQIEKIKEVRNKIAHSSDMSLGDQEYEKYWTKIENSLINLGLNKKDIEHFKLNFNSTETKEINDEKILDYKKGDGSFLNQNHFPKSIESKGIDLTLALSQKKNLFFHEKPNHNEYFQQLAGKWIANTKSFDLKTNGTGQTKLSNATISAKKSITISKSLGLKTNGTGLAKLSNSTKSVGKSTANTKLSVLKTNGTGLGKLSNATKSAEKSTINTKSLDLKTTGTGLAKLSSASKSVGKLTANTKSSVLKTNGTGQGKLSNATKSAEKSTINTKSLDLKTTGTGLAKLSYAIKSADRSTTNTKFIYSLIPFLNIIFKSRIFSLLFK